MKDAFYAFRHFMTPFSKIRWKFTVRYGNVRTQYFDGLSKTGDRRRSTSKRYRF